MDDSEWPEVATSAAHIYESILVPAIFDECVPRLLDLGRVQSGDRVLDVACGTGIVSRRAVERVGPRGNVVGLDLECRLFVAEIVADENAPTRSSLPGNGDERLVDLEAALQDNRAAHTEDDRSGPSRRNGGS